MRLTVYTDYTLRVMMYLALKYPSGDVATIDEISQAYKISRNHLMKIIHELSQVGLIETTRGRAGGARLAREPKEISVGEIVRVAEKDFSVVRCHDKTVAHDCAIFPACDIKRRFYRAVEAFLQELDTMTLREAISAPAVAASASGVVSRRERAPAAVLHPRTGRKISRRETT